MTTTRTELISQFKFTGKFADPISNPIIAGQDEKDADPDLDGKADEGASDNPVDAAVAQLQEAAQALKDAQANDSDASEDPNDKPVNADVEALLDLVDKIAGDQANDDANEPDESGEAGPAKLAAKNKPPKATPVDDDGNIEPTEQCANPDCGHFAGAHENDPENGDNSGACGMKSCECSQMELAKIQGQVGDAGSSDEGGGPDNAGGDDVTDGAHGLADVLPNAPVVINALPPTATLNAPPEMTAGENAGPAFTIPALIIEGMPTSDGREIALEALTFNIPPLPLMFLKTATHDPTGMDQNLPAVICGVIETLERIPGEGSTQLFKAQGHFLATLDGLEAADTVASMGRCGISGDVQVVATEISPTGDVDEFGIPVMREIMIEGIIMGATVCPFPAFNECYIVIGDGEMIPETIPQQNPNDESVVASGQLVHFMTIENCEPCAQGDDVLVASGAGPVAPPKSWFENPNFTEGDGRLLEIFTGKGDNRFGGSFACPITVTEDGEVFGHIAPWGVCHTGREGCVTAPSSKTDYAYFKTGSIVTAEGETIRTGVITANTNHAPAHARGGATIAHYDNTGFACADVAIGEDAYGIWVHGAIRPDATEAQIRALRASSSSGDWRSFGGNLELCAILQVNQPGFPLAFIKQGRQQALVAAGADTMFALANPGPEHSLAASGISSEDHALRAAMQPLMKASRKTAMRRIIDTLT